MARNVSLVTLGYRAVTSPSSMHRRGLGTIPPMTAVDHPRHHERLGATAPIRPMRGVRVVGLLRAVTAGARQPRRYDRYHALTGHTRGWRRW
jgi:hypothetical protein